MTRTTRPRPRTRTGGTSPNAVAVRPRQRRRSLTTTLVAIIVFAVLLLAALGAVTGLGASHPAPGGAPSKVGTGSTAPASTGIEAPAAGLRPSRVAAAWEDTTHLRLVLWGSSTCPFLPTLTSTTGTHLSFTAHADGGGSVTCVQDDAPGTTIVALPAGLTSEQALTVEVGGHTVPVPALPVATIVMD